MMQRIVETCNFDKDYPNESFLPVPPMRIDQAKEVAMIINEAAGEYSTRYWKVVDVGYVLAPKFEP